jgi:hypothetical protein
MDDTVLIDIRVDAGEALKNLEKQKEAQRLLKEETAKLIASQKELIAQGKTSDAAYSTNSQKIIENEAKLKNLGVQMSANQKIVQQSVNATKGEEGAYQRLNQEYAVAAQRAKDLGAAYGTQSKQAVEASSKANALNDELKKIDKTVGQSQRGVGEYERGIGGVATAMGGLPGPIGRAITSVKTLTKALWAVVATPVGAAITAIVAAFALLAKAFKATDEGATKLAGALKAVGNVIDVLLDRTMSFFKMLGSLARFDFDGLKKNAKDAFGGIGSQIRDTTKAGFEYAEMMDWIGDREAASLLRAAKLRTEIANLQTAMRNQMLTDKERVKAGEEGMKKEIELFKIEKGFQEERASTEMKNLATKIQVDKWRGESDEAYMKRRERMLESWLAIDDKQLKSAMENNTAFGEFYNKNEGDIQKLQKMKADTQMKDEELAKETRRLMTGLNTLRKELTDEAIANEERRRTAEIKGDETALEIRRATLQEGSLMSDAYYKSQLENEKALADAERAIVDKEVRYGITTKDEARLKKIQIENEYNASVRKLSLDRVEMFATAIRDELDLQTIRDETLITEGKLTASQQNQLELDRIERDRKARTDELELRLQVEPEKEKEILRQIEIVNAEARLEETKKRKEWERSEDDRISNANITNLKNKIDSLDEYSSDYIKFQKMLLDEQMAEEIRVAEESGAQVFLIESKYAKLKKNLDEQVIKARLSALSQMFSDIEGTFGENTKIAKMAASAQTAIATYQSATEAYKSLAGIPVVGPALGGIAAAAAVASGLANVRKIWATQSGLKGDTGGSTAVSASVPASAMVAEQAAVSASTSVATSQPSQDITGQVAAGVSQALQDNPIQPVLVTSDVTTAINTKVQLKNDNSI